MGYVLCFKGMPDEAVGHLEQAMELNRNFTDWRLSMVLVFAGRAERAIVVEAQVDLLPDGLGRALQRLNAL